MRILLMVIYGCSSNEFASNENYDISKIWTKIRWKVFSYDKIFGTKQKFRQLCLTKFCPIRYIVHSDSKK